MLMDVTQNRYKLNKKFFDFKSKVSNLTGILVNYLKNIISEFEAGIPTIELRNIKNKDNVEIVNI